MNWRRLGMPLGLRVVRAARWYPQPWLTREMDLPSTALCDLLDEKSNSISIWLINDDRSNFERVIAALAANRNQVANLDYALFDIERLAALRISSQMEHGDTADSTVNMSFHLNLTRLTARNVFFLAREIHKFGDPVRIRRQDVQKYIEAALSRNELDRSKIDPGLLRKVTQKP